MFSDNCANLGYIRNLISVWKKGKFFYIESTKIVRWAKIVSRESWWTRKKKIVEQIYDNNSKIINDIDNNTDE